MNHEWTELVCFVERRDIDMMTERPVVGHARVLAKCHCDNVICTVFTARCYAERGIAIACRLSVRLSVRNVEVL